MTGMIEKPVAEDAPSRLFAVGRYLLSPRVMELLSDQQPGAGNEIQLADAMVRAMAEEEFCALVIDVHEGYDTGTPPPAGSPRTPASPRPTRASLLPSGRLWYCLPGGYGGVRVVIE